MFRCMWKKNLKMLGWRYINQYESYMVFSSTMYFNSANPHFLLVCLRGLGFVFRVASLRLAISNKKGPFLNKAICCVGVLSFSIIQKHAYKRSEFFSTHGEEPQLRTVIFSSEMQFLPLYQQFNEVHNTNNQSDYV